MKKKSLQLQNKLKKILQAFFVCLIVALPLYSTGSWVYGAIRGDQDPRKVVEIEPLQPRSIDTVPHSIRAFEEPAVSITFDDGWESIYTNAVPVMQREGLISTQFIITSTFDNHAYMSEDQIKSLQASGTEIGSHTVSHKDMTTLTNDELDYELGVSKTKLEQSFGAVRDFTSPLGAYNNRTIEFMKKYYRSHKNAEGDPAANELQAINIKDTFNIYNIKSYSVRSTTTDDDIKKLIQAAEKNNAWLVLTYHQVDDSSALYSVTPDAFARQMSLVSKSNLRSTTIGSMLDTIEANP